MTQIFESLLAPHREDKWKVICQIKEDGNTVGFGCLVYDPQIKNPELSKYCIISSSKVILPENVHRYCVRFERVSNSENPRDILLSDIIKKDGAVILSSGLVLVFIDRDTPQLHHRGCIFQKECSVLKHLPEISSPSEGIDKFCYIGGKPYKYDETSGIDSPEKARSVTNGCVIFERDPESKKLKVVGVINCFNSGQEDFSPIWLKSSSLEKIIGEFVVVKCCVIRQGN